MKELTQIDRRTNYYRWKQNYQAVYDKFITSCTDTPSMGHVKIAVLDTGIDLNHPDVQAYAENIKAKYNCLNERASSTVHDLDGHGTFVTSLLLDFAPDAEIYVIKVADKKPASPLVIAKVCHFHTCLPDMLRLLITWTAHTYQAINHAVDVWNVDIISMSFGFPTRAIEGYNELELAIKHAYYRDVLLFAAASNSGGQLGRAYPAREANVICVHSTDARGNRSPFSPTALPQDVNLATVGEAVTAAWPMHLCGSDDHSEAGEEDDGIYSTVKSGTSYATPIMAGIAAFLLLYARLNLPENARLLKIRSRMMMLLSRIAQKGPGGGLRDDYHFVDVSLYADSLCGKDKALVDQIIKDILNN